MSTLTSYNLRHLSTNTNGWDGKLIIGIEVKIN